MKHLLLIMLMLSGISAGAQQRTSSPVVAATSRPTAPPKKVKEKKEKPAKAERPGSVIEVTDDQGNSLFLDTISGNEWVDSVALAQPKAIGNIYPLLEAVNVGIDLFPALNRAFGADYGLGSVWARLSLHNRYFVAAEFGLSNASDRPAQMNYRYQSPVCPYFKIGADYNFFYNSNPDYQLFASVRYGLTPVRFRLLDVEINNGYWGATETPDFPMQTSWNGFLQIGAGIHVKVWGPIAIGWGVRYQKVIHHTADLNGQPWSIPGMGKRTSELGCALSIIYTIPLYDRAKLIENNEN